MGENDDPAPAPEEDEIEANAQDDATIDERLEKQRKEREERKRVAFWSDLLFASVLIVPATAILSWIGFRNWRTSKKVSWWQFWKAQRWGYSSWGWATLERRRLVSSSRSKRENLTQKLLRPLLC